MPVVLASPETDHVFRQVRALETSNKIASCIAHFEGGQSWEETGIIDSGLAYVKKAGKPLDGCTSRADFLQRYEKLDRLFESLSNGGELYSDPRNDAIAHIDEDGGAYFSGGAHHRTAMAWILDIHIPFRPFLIHPKGKAKLCDYLYENKPLPDDLNTIWRPDPSPLQGE